MSDEPRLPVATEKALEVPPALVQAVQEDPSILVELSRSQLLVVQDLMVRRLIDTPDASISAHAAVHEAIRKNAQMDPKGGDAQKGTGFSVVINLNNDTPNKAIEVKAERVNE